MKLTGNFFLFIIFIFTGCETSETGSIFNPDAIDVISLDTKSNDVSAGPKKLSFLIAADDYGQSCVNTTTCNLKMTYNSDRRLEVKYTLGNELIGGAYIYYENVNDPNGVCTLSASQVPTESEGDKKGIAGVNVKNQKPVVGQCQIKVTVSDDPTVNPIYFNIAILPKGTVALTVGFKFEDYKGNNILNKAEFYLFKQTAQKALKCSELDPDNLPTADIQSLKVLISQTAHFMDLPQLSQEGKQTYTILGVALDQNDVRKAYGCDDVNGIVEYGQQQVVWLKLIDEPLKMVGSYNVSTTIDLVSGLPSNIEMVVDAIIGFFQSPGGQIMLLICQLTNSDLETMCSWFFKNPNYPTLDQLTGTGDVAFKIIDAILVALIESNCPFQDKELCHNIYWTGQDIGDMLKKLELRSTFTFLKEPEQDGTFIKENTIENWHTVVFQWTLGKNCNPNDDECGKIIFNMQQIPEIGEVIKGKFDGKIDNLFYLTVYPHTVNLKYGALINFAIQKIILPKLFGDGSDGNPAVDSYEKMIGSLLGGKDCLKDWSCCDKFAENLTKQATGMTKTIVAESCNALIQLGAPYLQQMLTKLDLESDNFTIGTMTPCKMFDSDNNMKVDAWGKKSPKEERCVWDAKLKVGNGYYNPSTTFYATEMQ